MDDETLTALRGSIDKWRRIVAGTGTDEGAYNCPLCALFYTHPTLPNCTGCPVYNKTSAQYCINTPHIDTTEIDEDEAPDEYRAAAQRELDFLISLLPPGELP